MTVHLICRYCLEEITVDRDGLLGVNESAARRAMRAHQDAEKHEHPHAAAYMASQEHPTVKWWAHHTRCDFDAYESGERDIQGQDGDVHHTIAEVQPLTLAALLDWNRYLNEQPWVAHTDWNGMLAGATKARTRIVIKETK